MKKSNLMPAVVLGSICLIMAVLLSVINTFTAPIIEDMMLQKEKEAIETVLPNVIGYEELSDLTGYPESVQKGYKVEYKDAQENIYTGYVFQTKTTGYKSGLILMCGIDANGAISGIDIIDSKETNGAENTLKERYIGSVNVSEKFNSKDPVYAIARSTRTSEAFHLAMKDSLTAYAKATQASADGNLGNGGNAE